MSADELLVTCRQAAHHFHDLPLAVAEAWRVLKVGGAYVFTDRATWSSFKNRGDHRIAVEGDRKLFNQYGVILVNPKKHPKVKVKEGQAFIDWLLGDEGQKTIADYKLNGQQLFFPNGKAKKSS